MLCCLRWLILIRGAATGSIGTTSGTGSTNNARSASDANSTSNLGRLGGTSSRGSTDKAGRLDRMASVGSVTIYAKRHFRISIIDSHWALATVAR